jgi:uracil-DNA glycosylase
MTEAERRAALEAIAAEVRGCTRCRLHETRTRAVPGEGHPSTEVVFVGEGPGMNEDRQGRPFIGRAGDLLVKLLGTIGWRRDEVFITNIVKCRPPDNRDPEPDEIAACAPYLRRQLEILDPALVVTLGRHSLGRFMPGDRIGQVHGTYRPVDPSTGARAALAYALYHPAAALRSSEVERQSYDDVRGVPAALLVSRERREPVAEVAVRTTAAPARERGSGLEAAELEPAPAADGTARERQPALEAAERAPELAFVATASPDRAAISAPLLADDLDSVGRAGQIDEGSGSTAERHDPGDRTASAPHSVPEPAVSGPAATPRATETRAAGDKDAFVSGGADILDGKLERDAGGSEPAAVAMATTASAVPTIATTSAASLASVAPPPPAAAPAIDPPSAATPAVATTPELLPALAAATNPNPTTSRIVEPADQLTAF